MTAEASCREGLSATEQWAPELRSDWTLVLQDPDRLGEAQSLRAMEKGWEGQSSAPAIWPNLAH